MKLIFFFGNVFVGLVISSCLLAQPLVASRAIVDLSAFCTNPNLAVEEGSEGLVVTWKISDVESGRMVFNLDGGHPLIESLGIAGTGREPQVILKRIDPVVLLTVGERDLTNPAGWVAFFDNPPLRAYRTFALTIQKHILRVASKSARTILTLDEVAAGPFRGKFQFTFFRDSALILAEAIMQTDQDGRAILYDAGLSTPTPNTASLNRQMPSWRNMAWLDPEGKVQRVPVDVNRVAGPVTTTRRAIAAEGVAGTVAVFPPPHQYFYPLDFATNLGFAWFGRSGDQWQKGYGFGIRQPPLGDKRWVAWCNAPPHTAQHLGLFYFVSSGNAAGALAEVSRYTHEDHFKKLPGYATFSSHYHIEHALELTQKREELKALNAIPPELETPRFVKTFKARGIDIVHLAEFHIAEMPRLNAEKRLPLLKTLYEECARLSDEELLVLPGEEPNVHLGGHWISLFPKPVFWVLNRAKQAPFVETREGYGKVYHVGNADDVRRLMEEEDGLMWTAHPRIKGSRGFPDNYFDAPFYRSDHFLGGAWKSMPVDLSLPRLGTRALDLQDTMANRGERKYILGEEDIFRVEPEMETYAHMNINYLRLDRIPRFAEGWKSILDALRGGRYFVSTGEVLIPEFTAGGKESGATLVLPADGRVDLRARLEWTFPLSFAEIISGDGRQVFRQRIDLSNTEDFKTQEMKIQADLKGRKWVRLECWDVAHNGAFTPPIWLR